MQGREFNDRPFGGSNEPPPLFHQTTTSTGSANQKSGVGFLQFETRISAPLFKTWAGITSSMQLGVAFDRDLNVSVFWSPTLGGGGGGSLHAGISLGYFPGVKSVEELRGLGTSLGFAYMPPGKFLSGEINFLLGEDGNIKIGGTTRLPRTTYGKGFSVYSEFSYTFMSEPKNLLKFNDYTFNDFVNSLPILKRNPLSIDETRAIAIYIFKSIGALPPDEN